MQAETAKLTVHHSECLRGIPLVGMDSVKSALQKFSDGVRGSNATTQQLATDGNPIAMMMKMAYVDSGGEGSFLKELFADIEASLKKRDKYSRHYDYDGVGSFFKTTVEVTKLPNNIFLLGLNAAYVGDKVEVSLAEALGVERALSWAATTIELPVVGNLFIADFVFIINALAKAIPLKGLTAEKAVAMMTERKRLSDRNGAITVYESKDFTVTMVLDDVSRPMQYKAGNGTMVWKVNSNSILGPLHPDWVDESKVLKPLLKFTVSRTAPNAYDSVPFIDAEGKNAMRNLAEMIASAFR